MKQSHELFTPLLLREKEVKLLGRSFVVLVSGAVRTTLLVVGVVVSLHYFFHFVFLAVGCQILARSGYNPLLIKNCQATSSGVGGGAVREAGPHSLEESSTTGLGTEFKRGGKEIFPHTEVRVGQVLVHEI